MTPASVRQWFRTCQSCGHRGEYKSPLDYKSDAWRDTKCRSCGSIDLDYGTTNSIEADPQP